MNIKNERKLASHVRELGESASSGVFNELIEFAHSESPLLRRLAASAIGKLAGIVDSIASVDLLRTMLTDTHPQVRQYSAKALGAFGAASACAIEDLRDMYKNPTEKEYVKRSVTASGKLIKEAIKIAEQKLEKTCSKCGRKVESDEYARSMKAFSRIYCDHCFDEVYIMRRNYDTKVDLKKTIKTNDGCLVQSDGERIIANFLHQNSIQYRYDERIRIIEGYAIRPDFYLPEFDIYIEYWGMDTVDYKIGMLIKKKLYQQQEKKLLSVSFKDKHNLVELLKQKLSRYMRI